MRSLGGDELNSINCIDMSEFVYIIHCCFLYFIFFSTIFIAISSAVYMKVSLDSAPLVVIFVNSTAKPTFFSLFLDPST